MILNSRLDPPMYNGGQCPHVGAVSEKSLALAEPFAVYGAILRLWEKEGGIKSKYGGPLCDERDLPDGGRCSVFEGGHIHCHNGEAKEYSTIFTTSEFFVPSQD